jgi:hypothetical protein
LIPLVFALGVVLLAGFVFVERKKERRAEDPLFEFGQLRHRTFRYGLVTTAVLAMGQLGLLFALAVFLQDGRRKRCSTNSKPSSRWRATPISSSTEPLTDSPEGPERAGSQHGRFAR